MKPLKKSAKPHGIELISLSGFGSYVKAGVTYNVTPALVDRKGMEAVNGPGVCCFSEQLERPFQVLPCGAPLNGETTDLFASNLHTLDYFGVSELHLPFFPCLNLLRYSNP